MINDHSLGIAIQCKSMQMKALQVPASAVSAIAIEAYKKYVLCLLLHVGCLTRAHQLPRNVPRLINQFVKVLCSTQPVCTQLPLVLVALRHVVLFVCFEYSVRIRILHFIIYMIHGILVSLCAFAVYSYDYLAAHRISSHLELCSRAKPVLSVKCTVRLLVLYSAAAMPGL